MKLTENELMPESQAEKMARRLGTFTAILTTMAVEDRLTVFEKTIILTEISNDLFSHDKKLRDAILKAD